MRETGSRGPSYDWEHESKHWENKYYELQNILGEVGLSADRLSWENYDLKAQLTATQKKLEAAEAKLAKAVEALEFYAEPTSIENHIKEVSDDV